MNCYHCRTPMQLLTDGIRKNLILTKDEEVEPAELMECGTCGSEYTVHAKEAGTVIIKNQQYRA